MIRTGSWLSERKHRDRENLNDMHFLKKPCKHRDNKQSKKKIKKLSIGQGLTGLQGKGTTLD